MIADPWWPLGPPAPGGPARLICLPYAGGGASAYRGWRRSRPADLTVLPVQLPGREGRIRETPFRGVGPLVESLIATIPSGIPHPFALFGHSMGALIAFELARSLASRGLPGPDLLVASAARPPHLMRREEPLHDRPDAAFRAALRELDGTPEAVLEHEELMELLLPTLRADFEVCERYEYRVGKPLTCPILTIGGRKDPDVPLELLREWARMTEGGFSEMILPEGHFFLESHAGAILGRIGEEMARAAAEGSRQAGS